MTGGWTTTKIAEVYNPESGSICKLPDLPDERTGHSQDGGLLCGGGNINVTKTSCLQWSTDSGSWEKSHVFQIERIEHSSWTPTSGAGTYLFGGVFGNDATTGRTTEIVKPDGSYVDSGFKLEHGYLW